MREKAVKYQLQRDEGNIKKGSFQVIVVKEEGKRKADEISNNDEKVQKEKGALP